MSPVCLNPFSNKSIAYRLTRAERPPAPALRLQPNCCLDPFHDASRRMFILFATLQCPPHVPAVFCSFVHQRWRTCSHVFALLLIVITRDGRLLS